MGKMPRDLSGVELAKLLKGFGFEVVRQSGSHIRMTSKRLGADHHITIPAHDPLKVGTLSSILSDVAQFLKRDRKELERELFG